MFETEVDIGLGNSKRGRARIKEIRDTICKRKRKWFKFMECALEHCQATPHTQTLASGLPPELEGTGQKRRIRGHLGSIESLAQRIGQVALRIMRSFLPDFEDAPDETKEDIAKQSGISKSDLLAGPCRNVYFAGIFCEILSLRCTAEIHKAGILYFMVVFEAVPDIPNRRSLLGATAERLEVCVNPGVIAPTRLARLVFIDL